jgi:hypothetical protein
MFSSAYGLGNGDPDWGCPYDLDRNGLVGFGDFSIFTELYGTTYSYAPGGAVPEPATAALAAAAALALAARRRRGSAV